MIEDKQINQLSLAFKRIFALPVSRSTFREIQNAILSVSPGTQKESSLLFESLMTGNPKPLEKLCSTMEPLSKLIDEFSVGIRVAKDVYERGEFISLASADIITQANRIAFLNRIRRVDGEEMQFLTDIRGTISLLTHLVNRLQEAGKNELGKSQLRQSKNELKAAKERLNELLS